MAIWLIILHVLPSSHDLPEDCKIKMAALDESFLEALTFFKITDFNAYQKLVNPKIVVEKLDILVSLSTDS